MTLEAQRVKEQARIEALKADQRPVGAKASAQHVDPDATGVLDRLRRDVSSRTAPTPTPRPAVQANQGRRQGPGSRGNLEQAREALAAGRIVEARRLLQVAQLQLVFRPIDPEADEPPPAGRAAVAVAHALTALGTGDARQAMNSVDQALAPTSEDPPTALR